MSAKTKRLWPVLVVITVSLAAFTVASTRTGKQAMEKAEVNTPQGEAPAVNMMEVPSAPASPAVQDPTLRGVAQIVRFTIYDSGIYPREAQVSAGLVVIQVEDMAGDSPGVVVRSESRQVVGQIMRAVHRRGNGRLRLPPGRYQIHELSDRANTATLIVEPQ
jgi:hypothetical protein